MSCFIIFTLKDLSSLICVPECSWICVHPFVAWSPYQKLHPPSVYSTSMQSFCLTWSCTGLMSVVTGTVSSYVQLLCCVQITLPQCVLYKLGLCQSSCPSSTVIPEPWEMKYDQCFPLKTQDIHILFLSLC